MNGLVSDGWEGSLSAWRQMCISHWGILTHESYIVVALNKIQISARWDLKLSKYTLEYVYPMFDCDKKRLEYLELTSTQDGELLDATLLDADLLAAVLSSLPALVSLNLNATNILSDPFLLALGCQCRSLRDLTLTGTFTLKPLATAPSVLSPCLSSLQLGSLTRGVAEVCSSFEDGLCCAFGEYIVKNPSDHKLKYFLPYLLFQANLDSIERLHLDRGLQQ